MRPQQNENGCRYFGSWLRVSLGIQFAAINEMSDGENKKSGMKLKQTVLIRARSFAEAAQDTPLAAKPLRRGGLQFRAIDYLALSLILIIAYSQFHRINPRNLRKIPMRKVLGIVTLAALLSGSTCTANADVQKISSKKLSPESLEVAELLLSHQVKSCVEQLQNSGHFFSLGEIKKQIEPNGKIVYTFSGLARDIDIALGTLVLEVTSQVRTGAFGQPSKVHACKLSGYGF